MTSPVTLHLLLAPLVLGEDTVPAPAKGTKLPNNQNRHNPPANTPTPIDGFFPNAPNNQTNHDDQGLQELGQALGSVPAPVRRTLEQLRAHHLVDRLWFYLGDEGDSNRDSIYILPDNRILRLAPFPSDLKIYVYDTDKDNWTELGSRTNDPEKPHSNTQISNGIKAILESRKERGWVSPTTPKPKSNLEEITRHADFTEPLKITELSDLADKIKTKNGEAARLLEAIINDDNILRAVDKDRDGKISKEEIISLAQLIGDSNKPELTKDDLDKAAGSKNNLQEIIQHPDFTRPLKVSELSELAEKIKAYNPQAGRLLESIINNDKILNAVDKDGDGHISREEIATLAKLAGDTNNPDLTQEDLNKVSSS